MRDSNHKAKLECLGRVYVILVTCLKMQQAMETPLLAMVQGREQFDYVNDVNVMKRWVVNNMSHLRLQWSLTGLCI